MLAGLLAIPKDYYEAARVDGCTRLSEVRYITLPLMRMTLFIVTMLQILKALKVFVPIYILTKGGPAGTTRSMYYLVFERIQRGENWFTYASTVGWIFTFVVIAIALTSALLLRVRRPI